MNHLTVTEHNLFQCICPLDVELLFVVGEDDQSTKLVESFSDVSVSRLIAAANCVAVLLPSNRLADSF